MRRAFDILLSAVCLCLSLPIIALALLGVWLQDRRTPIYTSWRVGKDEKPFRFYKIRTMVVDASKAGRHTTSSDDPNVTALGRFLRRAKVDELLQFWTIIQGQMSLVGPRPNTPAVIKVYTPQERGVFQVKPGLTDFSSIVFSDLDTLMAGAKDVNAAYDQTIRPWKSRLGLFYVANASLWLDIQLLGLTALNFINRPLALKGVVSILQRLNAPQELIHVAARHEPPAACAPPGDHGANLSQMAHH
ncbi:MAG: sugar transferase [Pseudomonadota bacterium]